MAEMTTGKDPVCVINKPNTIVCFSIIKLLVFISQVRLRLVIVTSKPNPSGLKVSRFTSRWCSTSMAGGQGLLFILFSVGDQHSRSCCYLKLRWSPSQSYKRAPMGPPSAVTCSCLEVTCIASIHSPAARTSHLAPPSDSGWTGAVLLGARKIRELECSWTAFNNCHTRGFLFLRLAHQIQTTMGKLQYQERNWRWENEWPMTLIEGLLFCQIEQDTSLSTFPARMYLILPTT